ncbi:hypothetical protein E1189_09440 [Sansalvadorimonas verongulae]|nr:hypothetical protein [Sansalvadorimonas verongulae]
MGSFGIYPGDGTYYPEFSKVIHTEMFGHAVTISYVPVFSGERKREYFDDGRHEALDEEALRLKTLDVLFDFGNGKAFVLPLHVESELSINDTVGAAGEFFPFTDFFGAYALKKLKEKRKSQKRAVEGHFYEEDLFSEVDVYSPFHPFLLAVMRYFMNQPKQGQGIFDAVDKITVEEEDSSKAKQFPVRVHNGKNYVNLAAFQPPKELLGLSYSEQFYQPSTSYFTGSFVLHDSASGSPSTRTENRWVYGGSYFFEYNGNKFIHPSVVEIIAEIHGAEDEEEKHLYGLDLGEIHLKRAGEEFIKARMAHILAVDAMHREQHKRIGAGAKRRRPVGSLVAPKKGKSESIRTPEAEEIAVTVEDELLGWSDSIQRRVRHVLDNIYKEDVVQIIPRSKMYTEFGVDELMHPVTVKSAKR